MSSTTSRIVLGLSCAVTIGIVSYVHIKQQTDRPYMDTWKQSGWTASSCDCIVNYSLLSTHIHGAARAVATALGGYQREKMHEGVIRDKERQQRRKIENLYILEKQNELTKKLKKDLEN